MPQTTPLLAEVLEYAIEDSLSKLEVALPGRVEAYDDALQTASVQPLVKRAYYDEAGNRQVERLPVIHDVPVCFQGAGDCSITFPVPRGSTVMIIVASASLDKWLAKGGEVDDKIERRHHLADAMAIPGLRSRKNAIKGAVGGPPPSDGICMTAPKIYLGGDDATDPVVRRSDLDAVVTRLEDHSHPLTGTDSGGDTPGTLTIGTPSGSFSTPACSPVVRSK